MLTSAKSVVKTWLAHNLLCLPPRPRPRPATHAHRQVTFLGYGEWRDARAVKDHAESDYARK